MSAYYLLKVGFNKLCFLWLWHVEAGRDNSRLVVSGRDMQGMDKVRIPHSSSGRVGAFR
jgi:hypothetical protein